MKFPKRVIVNLSGGVDSAYGLYLCLKAGCDVLVHHIRLANHEGRQDVEQKATQDILAWLREQNLPGEMTYVESSFDYGDLEWIVLDIWVWTLYTGIILSNPKHRDRAVALTSVHADSPNGPNSNSPKEQRRVAILKSVCGFNPPVFYPIAHLTKADAARACPIELLKRCWWCRYPKNGQTCRTWRPRVCHTCKRLEAVLMERGLLAQGAVR